MIRVLVADDNAVDRKVLSTIVKAAGYEVTDAVDGHDALEKFYACKPDMVLLDALMPGKDGFAVAQEIKSVNGEDFTPVIFLTSLTDARDLAKCVDAGGDDFLSKPYNRVILQAKLSAMSRMREMHKTVQSQRDKISQHHMQLVADQEAAKAVFDNIAHSRQLECDYIRHLLSPLAVFNGDVLLAALTPSNKLNLLLGDFTGHGLAAAIGAMPLADVFYGMSAKGFVLEEILKECNRKLGSVLPSGYFCCATMLTFDFDRRTIEFWNGGLPSVYLKEAASHQMVPLPSENLPLGILSHDDFSSETLVIEAAVGDRVFLATDGVIEARDQTGDYFGAERLEAIIAASETSEVFDTVRKSVLNFTGDRDRDDDLTMVEVRMVTSDEVVPEEGVPAQSQSLGPRDWKFSYELGPHSLKEFNPLPLLQQVLMEAPYLRTKSSEIYTVLAELYSNGLEHGVLGLDSSLKSSADGFAQYYFARAKALENVKGFVRFEIAGHLLEGQVELKICVTDSGAGFDFRANEARAAEAGPSSQSYHGRGLRLLWGVCQQVEFTDPGNQVTVVMQWEYES